MSLRKMRAILASMLVLMLPLFVGAVEPDEILDDPALEQRARVISADVRCVVCQNESIDTSNAGIARDLRLLVRERLVAGDTNDEVFAYLVARYGDFVLLRPPWKAETYILWLTPYAIMGIGGFSILAMLLKLRSKNAVSVNRLSGEEEAALDAILNNKTKGTNL